MTKDEAIDMMRVLKIQDDQLNNESYELAMERHRCQEKMALLKKIIDGYDMIEKSSGELTEEKVYQAFEKVNKDKIKPRGSFIVDLLPESLDD